LVTYDKGALHGSTLHFSGVTGVSSSAYGPFNGTDAPVKQGTQVFLLIADGSVWGLNVLEEQVELTVELFPTKR
jgi:hypothetical protein